MMVTVDEKGAIDEAARRLLSKLYEAIHIEAEAIQRMDKARSEIRRLTKLIEDLAPEMSDSEKSRVLLAVRNIRAHPDKGQQDRSVTPAIVKIIERNTTHEWTAEEISRQLSKAGLKPEIKQIYNSLDYLQKKNQLRRIGRGRYLYMGGMLITSEDLGGEPARYEDD